MIDLKKIRVHDTLFVRIKNSIPILSGLFEKRQRMAIYYEQSYHEGINRYIQTHYDEINDRFYSNGIVFIYFPLLLDNLNEYIQYYYPDASIDTKSLKAEDFYNEIGKNFIDEPSTGRPMILVTDYHLKKQEMPGDNVHFQGYDLDYADDHQFRYALNHYLPPYRVRHGDIQFREEDNIHCVHEEEPLYGYDADSVSIEIAKEIRDKVELLYANGVPGFIIQKLFAPPEPNPSKLLITEDFRIFLPDYNDRGEVKISKLPKALYFLYLRYSAGIRFKELCDYRNELFDIYSMVSPREDQDGMNQSINDIVDYTKNSVNEKCWKIKNAFVSLFMDEIACQYYIDGPAGEPKRIALDRSLVEDLSGMIMTR